MWTDRQTDKMRDRQTMRNQQTDTPPDSYGR